MAVAAGLNRASVAFFAARSGVVIVLRFSSRARCASRARFAMSWAWAAVASSWTMKDLTCWAREAHWSPSLTRALRSPSASQGTLLTELRHRNGASGQVRQGLGLVVHAQFHAPVDSRDRVQRNRRTGLRQLVAHVLMHDVARARELRDALVDPLRESHRAAFLASRNALFALSKSTCAGVSSGAFGSSRSTTRISMRTMQ